ncbi:hypothetical protein HON86_01540 [Candidatus Woesearchaeota archaeon]|jgi:hypothetical protein|nr:hypothetical protein [Candidatus Woesearchaeota archaeon]MBT4835285.1 hypothetical protein [Candidatus Woesearchaeota archaeon]MBT6734762.1 hypothetical protein [Candidatus Woesearchaeota archaeon]MBT7169549.1 hypothetical protein [Candidatus Woesearchaeota archaeon]MBT7474351.1 hypothetical protein [Candidatus Woesearchaeota archaeon]
MVRTKKKGKNRKYVFSFEDPVNLMLHFIGLIIIIYGAWFHNVAWAVTGFIPMLVGDLWLKIHSKV